MVNYQTEKGEHTHHEQGNRAMGPDDRGLPRGMDATLTLIGSAAMGSQACESLLPLPHVDRWVLTCTEDATVNLGMGYQRGSKTFLLLEWLQLCSLLSINQSVNENNKPTWRQRGFKMFMIHSVLKM